ncbi:hypothetical protein AVO45_07175 [Ruegeria marisrubri]|uniref:VanZ-like domain-containing protein n=1 Tax=Ruegeria marisrubri TaxID=1685379 RepID=A0A0X3U1P0_9RHOB|nr:hypothetical protein AVO45_07175 [Ruegeria marisrubri]
MKRVSSNILALFDRFGLVLTLALMVLITAASLLPKESAAGPGAVDKPMHVIAYAVAVLPAAVVPSGPVLWLAAWVVAWGGAIELLQPLVGRSMKLSDMAANAVGVLVGLLVAFLVQRLLNRMSE